MLRLKLTKQSKTFLIHLYNLITDIRHHMKKFIIKHPPKITSRKLSSPPSPPNTRFVSEHIQNEIKKLTTFYQLTTHATTIKLYASPKKSPKSIHTILKKLYTTVLTLKTLTKNERPIHLTIYLTPSKKLIPLHPTHPLSPNEVNSGSTYTTSPTENGTITIWRQEELLRVTVHETLHAVKSDYTLYMTPILDNLALKAFPFLPADNNININEAYNELNSCIISAALSKHTKSATQFIKNLEYERLYSIKLAANILKYQQELASHIQSNTLTRTPTRTHTRILTHNHQLPTFYQESSIFSYYILKTAMLYDINTYIKFIQTQLPANLYPIFPPQKHLETELFMQVIMPSYKKFLPILTKLAKTKKKNKEKDRTLKMTIMSEL